MLFDCDLVGDDTLIRLSFVFVYLVLLVIWIVKKKSLLSNLMLFFTFIYLHMLFVLLFLPIPASATGIECIRFTNAGQPYFNIIPFKDTAELIGDAYRLDATGRMLRNIFGNIICFAPLGFLWPCLNRSLLYPKRFMIAALAVPVGVELTQLVVSLSIQAVYRFADIDDVILNFTGMLIGIAIFKLLARLMKKCFDLDLYELLFKKRKRLKKVEAHETP